MLYVLTVTISMGTYMTQTASSEYPTEAACVQMQKHIAAQIEERNALVKQSRDPFFNANLSKIESSTCKPK